MLPSLAAKDAGGNKRLSCTLEFIDMNIPVGLTHIAFDADDTLWGHEHVFVDAKAKCRDLLKDYLPAGVALEKALYAYEKVNLQIFGYGVKGFTLSMIETAIELSAGSISGREIQQIIDIGKEMIAHPIDLLPHVQEAVEELKQHYTLLLITKGDLFAQENKIARSGLAHHFSAIEIVSEKSVETYQEVFARNGIDPSSVLMIGNSLRSDVLPVLELGGHAAHLPYKFTWHHEAVAVADYHPAYLQPASLRELVDALVASGRDIKSSYIKRG